MLSKEFDQSRSNVEDASSKPNLTHVKRNTMKNLMLTSAAVLALTAAPALAYDWSDTVLTTTVNVGDLRFQAEGTGNGLDALTASVRFGTHNLSFGEGHFRAKVGYVYAGADYGLVGLEYRVDAPVAERVSVFGSVSGDYLFASGSFSNGDFFVTPVAGVEATLAPRVGAFAEVGYSFDATNDWSRAGGYAQVGVDFAVTDRVSVVPGVIRTFDTGNDKTLASLELVLNF